jgi:hypothetical protein
MTSHSVPLDYRSPAVHDARVAAALQLLRIDDAASQTSVLLRFAGGAMLCLIGPVIATGMVGGIAFRTGRAAPSSLITFCIVTAVLVPLLMWYERRSRGEFVADAMSGADPSPPSSYGEWEMRRTTIWWVFWTECALLGPRLLWSAIDARRGSPATDQRTCSVAAEIAIELFDAGQGMSLGDLVRADRGGRDVVLAAQFLVSHEWAGISSQRDRVWLSSATRDRLARLNLPLTVATSRDLSRSHDPAVH